MEQELKLLPDDYLEKTAECMRVLAHPVRLRIVNILMQGRFAVHEIAEICKTTPNQACEHLRLLKSHGLLSSSRIKRTVYYQIESPKLPALMNCIRSCCENQQE